MALFERNYKQADHIQRTITGRADRQTLPLKGSIDVTR
jgi:hypothetical protein